MGDGELILRLTKAIQLDEEKPVLDQKFNPTDPVAVNIIMYEVDFAIDRYMEKFKHFRDEFADPTAYDNFVIAYQQQARQNVKKMISEAQQLIAEGLEETEEDEEGDPDGGI